MIRIGLALCVILCSTVLLSSCQQHTPAAVDGEVMIDSLVPRFSHSFRVEYYRQYRLVKVFVPGKVKPVRYVLCADSVRLPAWLQGCTRVSTPVERVACLSTTHIGAMQLLDARSSIIVASNTELICDSEVSARVADGRIMNASHDYQPDYEMIAKARPQVLFFDGENGSSPQVNGKLKALHIKVAASRDYYEQDPLARAEWLKFFAAFLDKEKLADSLFEKVVMEYREVCKDVTKNDKRPDVFCNLPYNGIWYMPCGSNYVARLISDAGGNFLWADAEPINGLNLTLNFEQVYQRAGGAQIWINPGVATTLRQLSDQDAKFKLFKAFKTGHVYNCVNRLSPGGGMDIWETGTFRPDLVLRDLASIFHADTSTIRYYYYKQLR